MHETRVFEGTGISDEQIKAVMTEPRNSKVLDLDKVSLSDNDLEGLDDQLTALKESDSYLFNVKNEPQPTKSPVNVVSGQPKAKEHQRLTSQPQRIKRLSSSRIIIRTNTEY